MQIHELKVKHTNKGKRRIGRGGKKGTYSGKGIKGQKSRAGRKMVPIIRELIKKYPKLRGYRRIMPDKFLASVNLSILEKKYDDGGNVNPQNLISKGIVRMIKGRIPEIKILGSGKLSKKLTVESCKFSKTAKQAIEKAGGVVK